MNEGVWTAVASGVEIPNNQPPGSPRMWLARIHGVQSIALEDSTPHFRTVSVAGVWPQGHALPEVELHTIYRYFDFMGQPSVAMAVCAPVELMFPMIKLFKDSGATHTWFKAPESVAPRRAPGPGKINAVLDHAELYRQFETGLSAVEIATRTGHTIRSVEYVHKKWRDGKPAQRLRGRQNCVDTDQVIQHLQSGMTVAEVVTRLGCSQKSVYNIRKKYSLR
jgi:hypothetical protein